jgi:dethiobiotin synthetase
MVSAHNSRLTAQGYFITGTDTGVGKTVVSCALLHAFGRRGFRVCGMKPVAAGAAVENGRLVNDDVEALVAASNVAAPRDLVNPYCFEPAIAPHIAAAETTVEIDLGRLTGVYRELAGLADYVIVEGAGGFRVPLGAHADTRELAVQLGLPVVLVVGMRLGCLNHALLTAESVKSAGLRLAGWVANHIDANMARADENVNTLEAQLAAPRLARIPYLGTIDAAAVAGNLCLELLQ